MKKDDKKQLKKYFIWALIIILVILSYIIIKPFIIPLISAFILAYLARPIYRTLEKSLGKVFSALLCILIIMLIILIPLAIIVTETIIQAKNLIENGTAIEIFKQITNSPLFNQLDFAATTIKEKLTQALLSLLSSALNYLPSLLLSILIIAFGMYYILTKWDFLNNKLKEFIPFGNKKKIANEISKTTKDLIYGTILIGLIEFFIAAIGFYILGVKSYLVLAAIIFIFAFIPGLGPTIIWIPVAIYYLIISNYLLAIGTVILGIIISAGIDFILRTKILGDKSKINPLIMLIGILGGISVFGIFGFIIGPLILVYTIKIIQEVIASR